MPSQQPIRDPRVVEEREIKLRELAQQPDITDRLVKAIGETAIHLLAAVSHLVLMGLNID